MTRLTERLRRLEQRQRPGEHGPAERAAIMARVIAKAEAVAAGKEVTPADWSNVDAATVEHRRKLLDCIGKGAA